MQLHQNEEWLINLWRTKYRYGEIIIVIQDGLPVRIKKAVMTEVPPPIQ